MNFLRVISLALALLPALAWAQWQWIDKDGRKVFSDRSPPADVPAKNILKQPGVKNPPVAQGDATPAEAAAPAPARAASVPRVSGKDSALEEKKKQAEAAQAEQKKAEDEKIAKLRAENCVRANKAKATYESGVRIARANAKGEREFLDDATRKAEAKRVQDIIASDCQ
jgi:hypothetical protein